MKDQEHTKPTMKAAKAWRVLGKKICEMGVSENRGGGGGRVG